MRWQLQLATDACLLRSETHFRLGMDYANITCGLAASSLGSEHVQSLLAWSDGYDVETVARGDDAEARLAESVADLIVLD
jgi:hypothetical protein